MKDKFFKKWTEEEISVLTGHYLLMTAKQLSLLLPGRTAGAIISMAKYLGLSKQKDWTKEEDEVIKRFYPTMGWSECKKYLPLRNKATIRRRASFIGVPVEDSYCNTTKSHLNEDFCFNFENPETVYFLGFLWADGHIDKKEGEYRMFMVMNTDDYFAVQDIFKKVGWNVKHSLCKNNQTNKFYKRSAMAVSHIKFHSLLKSFDYGTKSGSSADKILAAIPENLRHYWWRGYFDGDGSFILQKNSGKVEISSVYHQDWSFFISLAKSLDFSYKHNLIKRKDGAKSTILLTNFKANDKFCSYIYQGDQFGLFRKRDKYLQYKNRFIQKIKNRKQKYFGVKRHGDRYYIEIKNKNETIKESYSINEFSEEFVAKRYDELIKKVRGNKAITNF